MRVDDRREQQDEAGQAERPAAFARQPQRSGRMKRLRKRAGGPAGTAGACSSRRSGTKPPNGKTRSADVATTCTSRRATAHKPIARAKSSEQRSRPGEYGVSREVARGRLALAALALMALLGAAEIAYGRLFEGLDAALGGRFTTPMSLLWIAIVILAAQLDPGRMVVAKLCAVPSAAFWMMSQVQGYTEIRDQSLSLFAAAQVIPRWDSATEDELRPLWPAEGELHYLYDIKDGPFLGLPDTIRSVTSPLRLR